MVAEYEVVRRDIERRVRETRDALFQHISTKGKLAIVKAPPGSGKTHTLLDIVEHAYKERLRVAVACQTNAQANDICRRLYKRNSQLPAIRFASGGASVVDLGKSITWAKKSSELPTGHCIVVGTTAKWGVVDISPPFDVLLIDEAWQMAWKDFMLCGHVAGRFVLIGDPGQIPPVITLDVARWETSPRPPHVAAPEVILEDGSIPYLSLELPASRRLPHDAVNLIQPFYDFPFQAYAGPGERIIYSDRGGSDISDKAIDLLSPGSVAGVTIPTPDSGPPLEQDEDLAKLAINIAKGLLARRVRVADNGVIQPLVPSNIGIASTHRAMNMAIELALPSTLRGHIAVDTAERWQGLERPIMIVVHPLSGVVSPSPFDLETGRLCVMSSRHLFGLIVIARDHLNETLDNYIPSATQAVGKPDVNGRGHWQHLGFWKTLTEQERVLAG
jgi:AAA domain